MSMPEQVPEGVDASRPSVARVYDCLLGGEDNFVADRAVFARVLTIAPDAPRMAADHRAFLWRVVHYLVAEAGIRRFLDIGCGLPSRGNVHEAARDADASARVVYVDNDPMVLAHGRALLYGDDSVTIVAGDARRPEEIMANPVVRELTESGEPFALMLLGILHHLTDAEDPHRIAARLRQALPSGGYLAISHFHNPGVDIPGNRLDDIANAEQLLAETLGTGRFRTYDEILGYFGDLELIEPGLVPLREWRPSQHLPVRKRIGHYSFVGGVARKN